MDRHELIEQIIKQIKQPIWSNWIIKERIGTGSFSEVYKIEADRGGRIDYAALKIEPLVATETVYLPEDKKMYIERECNKAKNESDIMYKLRNCQYVVRYEEELKEELYINGQFEGYYFLIRMEYLTCVHDMLRKRTLELSEKNIRKLAIDIGKGISAAHKKDIIHRDIKPNNLFFSQENNIYKLGDFNISKQFDTARTLTGTDGFIAPEIYRAKQNPNDNYTKQVDIYSFGITLYFLMNNLKHPFEDKLNSDLALDKRMSGAKLPKPYNASDKFGEIILKACEFDSRDRYQSVDEMIFDLENMDVSKEAAYIPKYVDLPKDENRTVYADSPDIRREEKGKKAKDFLLSEEDDMDFINDWESNESEPGFEETKKLAEQGDTDAQYALSNIYYDGKDVKKDLAKSFEWLQKAAENNHAEAQCTLGCKYLLGEYVKKDYNEARFWLQKSANQGNAYAQDTLNCDYLWKDDDDDMKNNDDMENNDDIEFMKLLDEMFSDLKNLDVGKKAVYIPKAVELSKDEKKTVYADSLDDEESKGAKQEDLRAFTPEEQALFDNFAVTKKIKKQIIYALKNMTLAPYTGNVIITGDVGLDTVQMAKNLMKEYLALDESFSGKLVKITGEKFNQRNVKEVFEELNNGGIIIEKANGMSEQKLYEMALCLSQDNLAIVVIMEDTQKEITKLLEKQAMIVDYFDIRIDLMEMDNNALVAYAKNYALALKYSIDDLGILALYTRIATMQSRNHVVTKDEVRDIIDEAIWKSKKRKIENFVDLLFAKRYDNAGMIILKERDFK